MQPVNFGILGASDFAARRMGPAIHAARGARLAALATSSPAKAAAFTAFAPDLTLHESYEALLADPAIEAVYIPLPNHLHIAWGIKALEAGKHVLIEKPLALTAAEIDPLIAARDASGKCAAEAYMIVHHPQWQLARHWLDAGRIGQLKHADAVFCFDNPDPANIRNRAETGGGSIPDIGVYAYSSIRFAARAEPVRLASRIKRENGVDTFAQVWGEMAGPGGEFTFAAMTSTRLCARQEVTFQGETGRITFTAPFNAAAFDQAEITLHGFNSAETHRFPGVNQYLLQVEAFVRHIRDGEPFLWTLEDARKGQAMIDLVRAGEI
ncbi:Gfo/Idh/MocA family oxidoreductase [Rhodobacter capsulatus]|uniref:Gfo/Idh/MocA family protein n=1 Tax=Rhodobacter capsulatus TaxID=1061 RepID=UPI0006DC2B38|nr:Gfo/Idh/MocA family oxidoreductase [Rhodobacter capsulatus]KQB15489.1 oxidoreductase [Rhodobacter capsulatus]KQB16921.1 oxidoreductase [Rhodobacter capsulatus]PZX28332.1 putative dehydrogenase [Rhodobacter capsulatus]QNR62621.1 Gfo/Idh/MocA family oxidoreductase [Rhodobacter capsulatus]